MLAPRYMPYAFYETSSFLSNATPEQVARYVEARASYYMADPAMNEGALARWELAVEPIANWLGVRRVFAGLFAVPAGLLMTLAVSAFTREPSPDVQAFVEELRKPAV
jgi:cation/acetate symporter